MGHAGVFFPLVFVAAILVPALAWRCEREPEGRISPKSPADNRFRIKISGNPDKYVPGAEYTVSLEGERTAFSAHKFTGFMIAVESTNIWKGDSPETVGTFHLYERTLATYSERCPNAVIQMSNTPKSHVRVSWTAPQPGNGCLVFKATVVEYRDVWFMDDGPLSVTLCEDVHENLDEQPEVIDYCCACEDAKYEVAFEGLWARHNHPKDFPSNSWLTRFSDVIGASHTADYRFWEYGGFASEGLRQVAENGYTKALESELKSQSDRIRTIIKARGISYPNLAGKTFAVFKVDPQHHLISLVSNIDPSPDWIVGVSGLELCLVNCSWVEHKVLNLYPWDAGIDSGVTYISHESPTVPQESIRRITSSFPNDPRSPFYDPAGDELKPLARLHLTRQHLYRKHCANNDNQPQYTNRNPNNRPRGGNDNGIYPPINSPYNPNLHPYSSPDRFDDYGDEISEESVEESDCAVSGWSDWSQCSVSCGLGVRIRRRSFLNPRKADQLGCSYNLKSQEVCIVKDIGCEELLPSPSASWNGTRGIEGDPRCPVTHWSPWSVCSNSCGNGTRTRTRHYLNHRQGRKKCYVVLMEQENCVGSDIECEEFSDEDDQLCEVTKWSDWSPCSATCGKGMMVRNRMYVVQQSQQENCGMDLTEEAPCDGDQPTCETGIDPCFQKKEVGSCQQDYTRWYNDPYKRICLQFQYSGCGGNGNNFGSEEECLRTCYKEQSGNEGDYFGNGVLYNPDILKHNTNIFPFPSLSWIKNSTTAVVNCQMSEWSEWSSCSATCGRGYNEKIRHVLAHSANGGRPCPSKMLKRRKCISKPCGSPDKKITLSARYDMADSGNAGCVLGEWSLWSACSRTCGSGEQERIRNVIGQAGMHCAPHIHRRPCILPSCVP